MSEELRAGAVFAGLRIERLVASGGMGSVYLAVDPTLHRRVALKVVADALAEDARYRDRFLVEAQLAASLEHQAIVPVYAAGESGGRLYLAMRYVDGGTLGDRLEASGRLDPQEAIRLLRPIADALDAAHRAGLVHRDVKPGNILLQADQALLTDFGLAVSAAPGEGMLSGDGLQLSGTMGYLAPEQIEGDRAGAAADQYALACVLFECLTGQRPFPRDNQLAVIYAHLQEPPPSLVRLRPDLPRTVDAVIHRGLAKQPTDRYESCGGLVGAVAAACGLSTPDLVTLRPRRVLVGAAALVIVAAVVVGAIVVTGRRGPPVSDAKVVPAAGDAVVVIDPATNRVVDRIAVGAAPLAIASGGDSVWVLNADDRTISRIRAGTHDVSTPKNVGGTPVGLAYGGGTLWVATGDHSDTIDLGTITDSVVPVDAESDEAGVAIPLRSRGRGPSLFHHGGSQIATGDGYVWAIDSRGAVEQIDPREANPTASVIGRGDYRASAVAFGEGGLWVLGQVGQGGESIWRIDPETSRRSHPIDLTTTGASDLAVGAGLVWVADPINGLVWPIDPNRVKHPPVSTGQGSSTVSFDPLTGMVWVANPVDGEVTRIDSARPTAEPAVLVSGVPRAITVADGKVFASVIGGTAQAAARRAPAAGDVPVNSCGDVFGDPIAPPDLVIAGDFPLAFPSSQSDTAAVESILREHRFRAGRLTVGYQPCDDPQPDPPDPTCADHARAYAQAQHVIAVITGFFSSCAREQLPILSGATGGPVAVISPQNTVDDLTDGTYPNFVRVTPTDLEHTAADVDLFEKEGVDRVFVFVQGGEAGEYPQGVARDFKRLGHGSLATATAVYGMTRLQNGEPDRHSLALQARSLAQEAERFGASGVFIVGLPDQAGELLKALNRLRGPLVIVAPDIFTPVSDAIRYAGKAANGVYVTRANPPNGELPPAGRHWLRRFADTQLGGQVQTSSVLAAAATEALLNRSSAVGGDGID